MDERIYVAIDVETTGLQAGVDEIIEVAAVRFRGNEILETFSQLVRPKADLPLKITRLTGITPADLADAPSFVQIGPELARFIRTYPLVGHSVSFDIGMLRAQGMNFTQPVYDTFELATLLIPQAPIYKLGVLAQRLGIAHPADHRALNDAIVAAHVFHHLLGLIDQLELRELSEIVQFTQRINWPHRPLFEEGMRRRARTIFTSLPNATNVEEEPAALEEWRQQANEPSPLRPTGDQRPVDEREVAALFASDGPLGQLFPGYEARNAQVEMARAVARTFANSEELLVEAGTGTGKSLAYLVPAALHAARRGERVVVSTNTINLQDQLFFKDIPALQQILSSVAPPFSAALLKGRSNYLCLKRYHEVRRSDNLGPDEVRALLKMQLWIPSTPSGDRAELLLFERENAVWPRVNVIPEQCTGPRCSHFRECFFFKARRNAEAAHLVVVNHALLLADINAQAQVLPPYDHLIIDEAHNLEDVATDQLSFSLDQAAMLSFLDDLYVAGGAQLVSGILSEVPALMRELNAPLSSIEKADKLSEQLAPSVQRAREATYDCFNALTNFVTREVEPNQYDTRLRLTPNVRQLPAWSEIQLVWGNLNDILQTLGTGLGDLETLIRDLGENSGGDEALMRLEWLRRFATDARVKSGHIILGDDRETIAWLTHDRQRDTLSLTAAPLSVADLLQAGLFSQKSASVLASATMSIAGNFEYIKNRIGLPEPRELQLESPFDYEKQALVFIPDDIPEPNQRGYQQAVEQALIDLARAAGGRTLALFTANSALRQTYYAIQDALEGDEIAVMAQGIDGSRRTLIERFKEFPRSILLGTTSFWEGVDVVGDALSVLVIAKLPFSVPNDPVFAARSEHFTDPFGEFSVPQTILRFKQGFGRLIRSREDRGIVVVLDKRLLSKKYGQQFLASLPHTRVRSGNLKQLPTIAKRFLG